MCLHGLSETCETWEHSLWSTLDYLIQMEEENEKLTSSFHIPKEDTLDFLFNDGGKTSPASSGRQRNDNCTEMGVVEPDACGSSEGASGDVAFEYCWCPACNVEFLSREELITHRKTHAKSDSVDRIGFEMEAEVSLEEVGLLSGELSILRSKLCCGKCGREFRDEGRLVAHINKHDFKCKPRNFEVLNAMLIDLRSIRSKNNALGRSTGEDLLRRVDSTCAEGERSMRTASLSSFGEDRSFPDEELTSSRGVGVVKGRFKTILNENGGSTSLKSSTDLRPKQSAVDLNEGEFRKENCCILNEVSSRKSLKMKELSLDPKLNGSPPVLLSSQRDEKSTNGSNVDCLFYCDYCSKPSESKSTMRKHIVMCHLSIEVHNCTVCHFVFPTERELKSHAALHTSKNKYICSVCNSNFTSKKSLIVHLNGSHGTNCGSVCSICSTGIPSRGELRFHHLSHEKEKKFMCSNCEKGFISEVSMKYHLKSCLKLTLYECETCHKVLYSKKSLMAHSAIHDTMKRFH
ncbi:PR domain zinc finger protein 5-like [Hetaerina americana]|uniref:PR domain zinc finger protein 5-like n=1 Tax=Hetaerina americana TaxID=62018 RepID=UPI003A7F29E2